MYCALHPTQHVRVEDIAKAHGVSRPHLLKAARQLGQLGFLINIRGRNGGVKLGMPADKIRIGDVVRHTEENMDLVDPFRNFNRPILYWSSDSDQI